MCGPSGCSTGCGHSSTVTDGLVGAGLAQGDPAEADPVDLALLELVQPGVVARSVLGRVGAVVAAVAQPQLGVLGDVLDLALHDPGVAAARHPGGEPLAPVLALDVLPVGEQLAPAAVVELVGGLLDQGAAQVVAAHAAVPVGEPAAPGRSRTAGWRRSGRSVSSPTGS